jgi:hypothetical protein
MGDTFSPQLRGESVDAVEGEFGMDERLRFVARLSEGEAMSLVCRDRAVGCPLRRVRVVRLAK